MASKYRIIITKEALKDLYGIYNYISIKLYAPKAADNIIENILKAIKTLKYSPRLYHEIDKIDYLNRRYRRVIVKNYIILYVFDSKNSIVYVSHIFYGRKNYL